jgi:hypothetical protein
MENDRIVVPGYARIIEVDGITYSREIFQHFADQARIGAIFRFVAKEGQDVTVELVDPIFPSDAAMEAAMGKTVEEQDAWIANLKARYHGK